MRLLRRDDIPFPVVGQDGALWSDDISKLRIQC